MAKCPKCGHCKECGRSDPNPNTYIYPYVYPYVQPYTTVPYTQPLPIKVWWNQSGGSAAGHAAPNTLTSMNLGAASGVPSVG